MVWIRLEEGEELPPLDEMPEWADTRNHQLISDACAPHAALHDATATKAARERSARLVADDLASVGRTMTPGKNARLGGRVGVVAVGRDELGLPPLLESHRPPRAL